MGEDTDTLVAEETFGLVAKKTLDIPVTLEKIEIEDDHIRRNLIGNLSIPNSEVKVLSRYLRAPVGSCHDSCKYGTKHVSETKARSPLLKRIIATPFQGQDVAETVILVQRKKTSVTSPKPLPDSRGQIRNKKQDLKKEVEASPKKVVISSEKVSSPHKGSDVSAKHASNGKQQDRSLISPEPLPDSQGQIRDKKDLKEEVSASANKVVISSEQLSSPGEGLDVSAKHASSGKQQEPSSISPEPLPDSQGQRPDKKKDLKEEVPASADKVVISSEKVPSTAEGLDVSAKHGSNEKQQEPSVTSPKCLSDSQGQIPDNNQQVIEKEIPAFAKKVVISSKQVSSPGEGSDVSAKHVSNGKQQEQSAINPKPLPDSKSQISNKQQVIKEEVSASAKKVVHYSKQVSSPGEGSDVSAEHASNGKQQEPSAINPKPLPDSNSQISKKQQVIKKEVSASAKKVVLSSKQVSSPCEGIDVSAKHAGNRKQQEPSVSSPKPLPNSKSQIPDKWQIIKKKVLASTMKQVSSPRERIMVSAEHGSVGMRSLLKTKPSPLSNLGHLSTRRFSEIIIPKGMGALNSSPVGGSSGRRKSDVYTSKEVAMRNKNDLAPPSFSPSPKPSVKIVLSSKSGSYKNPKRVSHLKNQNTVTKDKSEQPSEEKVPEKTLYVIETKPENCTVELTQNGSHTTHSSPSSKDENLGYDQNGMGTSQFPSSKNKNLRRTQNGIRSTQSSSSSSLSSENGSLKCTLNGTHEAKLSSSSLSLLSSSLSASKSLQNEEISPSTEHIKNETENQIANQKVEQKTRSRKVGGIRSEDKDYSSRKLNFRRAKLLDVKSVDNSPRRLRFRQVKVRDEIQNGKADTKRRSLRKIVDGKSNGTETESVKVVLRQQAAEGRNNVIEETASKHNFRRGKLVDAQSENNSPRRLRFRQRKIQDENQNGKADTKRRSLRKIVDGKSNGTEAESQKVVLRHQAVEGRKDVQSLFNNVIEETASKLVQTRKSKVKALVGAFETVISLQDIKSVATTSA